MVLSKDHISAQFDKFSRSVEISIHVADAVLYQRSLSSLNKCG